VLQGKEEDRKYVVMCASESGERAVIDIDHMVNFNSTQFTLLGSWFKSRGEFQPLLDE